ncbi:glycerate kinase [Polaromonas sp. UC242_47]|uniref:glycerate kinase n=1 Tax=Polaromonas sp. UC242_47 TaxID=3374626 RepID=UPI0037A2E7B7
MNFQKILVPIAGVAVVVLAYRSFGWAGVAAAAGGVVMWILLHFTRMLQVLKRAANRPIGYVDSAVMLNAKLRPGLTLLHVVAMTRALGELLSPKDEQPEIYRWTDNSESSVTATFVGGKLSHHTLSRPAPAEPEALAAPDSSAATAAPPSAP